MQFIPSSWATFGVDGDGDGKADPFDIDDAAASAAKYLCRAGGGDLSNEANQRNAVYSYNRSTTYVDTVMALAAVYAGGAPIDGSPAPNGTPRSLPPIAAPTLPPARSGDPPAVTTTTAAGARQAEADHGHAGPDDAAPVQPGTDDSAAVESGTDDHAAEHAGHAEPERQPVARRRPARRARAQPEPVAVVLGDEHAERDRLGRRHADRVGRRDRHRDQHGQRGRHRHPDADPVPHPPALPQLIRPIPRAGRDRRRKTGVGGSGAPLGPAGTGGARPEWG